MDSNAISPPETGVVHEAEAVPALECVSPSLPDVTANESAAPAQEPAAYIGRFQHIPESRYLATPPLPGIDHSKVIRWLEIHVGEGNFVEYRALPHPPQGPKGGIQKSTWIEAGVYDHDSLRFLVGNAMNLSDFSEKYLGYYVTLNPVPRSFYDRARNRNNRKHWPLASDRDIVRRRWLLIDVDPVRDTIYTDPDVAPIPKDCRSASAVEKMLAVGKALGIRNYLAANNWPEGSKRGLVFASQPESAIRDLHSPLYITEGHTDTIAMHAVGCLVVGRPAAKMSDAVGDWLLEYLKSKPSVWKERPVVVVADNDDAGRAGAEAAAAFLRKNLGKTVTVAHPPARFKDMRDWIRVGEFVSGWPFLGTEGVAQ